MPLRTFEEARDAVLRHAKPLDSVSLPLESAGGLYLAEPFFAQVDSPAFDNSAVDGFAVRASEVVPGALLPIQATISAGLAAPPLLPGSAIAIFTGAPMPQGADCAVMQEEIERVEGTVRFENAPNPGDFVRHRGEEYGVGDQLMEPGTAITPPVVGIHASNGATSAIVHKPPVVRIVSTGNELVEPGQSRSENEIFDGNGAALFAAVKALGIREAELSRVRDDREALLTELGEASKESNVVITSGGVSVGAKDLIKDVWRELGVEQIVWQVAMRPGKPFYLGVSREKLIFGLPGNPVSALVCFQLFCRPALLRMLGYPEEKLNPIKAKLTQEAKCQLDRTDFQRGVLAPGEDSFQVQPLTNQGSHMLGALAAANCLIRIPPGNGSLSKGSEVEAYPLTWH